jgi:hypothetical protein
VVTAFAIALGLGVVGLVAWIIFRSLAVNAPQWERADPERRLGVNGRRVLGGLIGFGMAGLSAFYAARDLDPWLVVLRAVAGAAAAAWYAGRVEASPSPEAG